MLISTPLLAASNASHLLQLATASAAATTTSSNLSAGPTLFGQSRSAPDTAFASLPSSIRDRLEQSKQVVGKLSQARNVSATKSTSSDSSLNELIYGSPSQSLLLKNHRKDASHESMMISKSVDGYYVFNNITLKVSPDFQFANLFATGPLRGSHSRPTREGGSLTN